VSNAIHRELVRHRPVDLRVRQAQLEEPEHNRLGGPAYRNLYDTMQSAQDRYLRFLSRERRGEWVDVEEREVALEEMTRIQELYRSLRKAHEPAVRSLQADLAREYWAQYSSNPIPDTFFSHCAIHEPVSRMARIHPPWWGTFVRETQRSFRAIRPLRGYLLDVLPALRDHTGKLTLEATVSEFLEKHAESWGWYGKANHRMLAIRTAKKGNDVIRWFDSAACGYLSDWRVRQDIDHALSARLSAEDPWEPMIAKAAKTRGSPVFYGLN
jgi:hypothetical protein